MLRILSICLIISSLISCIESETRSISVSACATQLSNGDIKNIACEEDKESNFDSIRSFLNDLDKNQPGPSIPDVYEYHKVISANNEGIIELENGVKLSFAGMRCKHVELEKYLVSFLIEDNNMRVVYLPTEYKEKDIVFAYIWEANPAIGKEYKQRDWNDYANPTYETALFSQWCEPLEQPGHKYHSRFSKIVEFTKSL